MPPPALRRIHSHSSVVFTQSLLIKLQKLPFYLSALLFQSDLKRENECHSDKLTKEAANSIGDLKHGKTAHMVVLLGQKVARRWEDEECHKNLARSMAVGTWFVLDQKRRESFTELKPGQREGK